MTRPWSTLTQPEKIAAVRDGITEGLTGPELAQRFGGNVSTITGIAWRAGLRIARRSIRTVPLIARHAPPKGITAGVHLADLGPRHCRAPLWGSYVPHVDDMRFCGRETAEGVSYCGECRPALVDAGATVESRERGAVHVRAAGRAA